MHSLRNSSTLWYLDRFQLNIILTAAMCFVHNVLHVSTFEYEILHE